MKQTFYLLIIVLILSVGGFAHSETPLCVEILPTGVGQGAACLVRVSGPAPTQSVHGEFQGKRFFLGSMTQGGAYEGLIGVDLDTHPGKYEIKVNAMDGGRKISSTALLKVQRKDFGTQRLSLPSSMVDLDAKNLEQVRQEAKRLQLLFEGFREERFWDGPFLCPVRGEITGRFGVRRIINGQRRSPHAGIDLEAEEGTPVMASNSGRVALAEELFFSGKSVILDHGWGTYSMYFHLSEILVQKGNGIMRGGLLGRVGSTGRSTGPHLHWAIKIDGARVDPFSLLDLAKHYREGTYRSRIP
ncbi:MAG TPA: M23 family metallopeptidase [Thermodesulfobacteriota bacterium]|nr:M23 family metallopeptidase [Thermodesulfobacteriota bacterium]